MTANHLFCRLLRVSIISLYVSTSCNTSSFVLQIWTVLVNNQPHQSNSAVVVVVIGTLLELCCWHKLKWHAVEKRTVSQSHKSHHVKIGKWQNSNHGNLSVSEIRIDAAASLLTVSCCTKPWPSTWDRCRHLGILSASCTSTVIHRCLQVKPGFHYPSYPTARQLG